MDGGAGSISKDRLAWLVDALGRPAQKHLQDAADGRHVLPGAQQQQQQQLADAEEGRRKKEEDGGAEEEETERGEVRAQADPPQPWLALQAPSAPALPGAWR